ncbi:unnamed protein product [Vicia faba]|uniref:Uncharacterized protein n=1 Tax=Vicia faba TaxID=3906 RepID=A0AAV0Z3K3_VICFA|nr:unnamed protein product [Vicia faba]
MDMMIIFRDNKKRPLFYSSFVHMILEINGVVSKEEDLVGASLIMDEYVVSKMRYYRDTTGMYYYLEKYGRKSYDDQIVEPKKDSNDEAGDPSNIGTTSYAYVNVKTLLDVMPQKLLVDISIREDRIMACIDAMAHGSEDNKSRMRENLRAEVKYEILVVEGRMITQIEALKTSVDYLGGNNFIFHHSFVDATTNVSTLVPSGTDVAPHPLSF